MKVQKKLLYVAAALLLAFLAVWGFALLRCENLTNEYASDFEKVYQTNTMLGEMEYCKVLNCSDTTAVVYFVSKGMTAADLLTYEKRDSVWEEVGWSTVWSTSGSASGVVWPYWWHFIYGGL